MQTLFWIGFVVLILGMLALDLGVLHRGASVVRARVALLWTGFCTLVAFAFGVALYFIYEHNWAGLATTLGAKISGQEAVTQYLTAWVIEQSLSLDNIFVIAVIFNYFAVPREYQHRTLFWGVIGALAMRAGMILAGAALIQRFHWIIYVFGAILIWTAYKMARGGDEKIEPERNPLVRFARRMFPITERFEGEKFFVRMPAPGSGEVADQAATGASGIAGRTVLMATPMFLVLLVIESTDLLFAIDSIPAAFAVTRDPFIVYTSNVFAILNLRSLYFALAAMIEKFRFLKPSLVVILGYVGVKMLLTDVVEIPTLLSLSVIVGVLTAGILASVMIPRDESRRKPSEPV